MIRDLAIALVAALLYAALGTAVAHAPPHGIDVVAAAVAGTATGAAVVFTASCWWEVLVSLGVAGIVVAFRARRWRARIVTSIVTTLVFWQVSNALKDVFRRPRPPYWHLIREPSWSYSSGHAMFATIVYWLWAYFVWKSDLPAVVRRGVATLLGLWGCAVIWSRLALGAHYVTDLAGGVLLGVVALALGSALRRTFARRAVTA